MQGRSLTRSIVDNLVPREDDLVSEREKLSCNERDLVPVVAGGSIIKCLLLGRMGELMGVVVDGAIVVEKERNAIKLG